LISPEAELRTIEPPADLPLETLPAASRKHSGMARVIAATSFLLLAALLVWSYASDGIVGQLCSSQYSADEKLSLLRDFFARFGSAAPLAYLLAVTIEVIVAPLPGAMLYAPGGVIFGGFWGGLLSLLGNVLGAAAACQLMRILGGNRAERLLSRSALAPYETRISQRGVWVVFLLRVNPLTSSDLVSYAAGLTHMPVWKLMLGTASGMAPLCFAQSYLAEGILASFPNLLYPLIVACAVYTLVVVWIMSKLLGR
jgi:uncharacterized membrane protein YdjX (TVP38/TMEM64 family)